MTVSGAVDDREPAGLVVALRAHPDVEAVEQRRLDAGDIVIGPVGIERKTLGDYVTTLLGRAPPDLYDQVERLAAAHAHSYLLLEADLPADGTEGVPAAAVRGSVASITARLGTPVIPCGDRARLVDLAVRLGHKHAAAPGERALPVGAVSGREEPTAKRMYGCIDGIGPEMAQRLYEAYPSVAALVGASAADLEAIEGIGPGRAAAIASALGTDGEQ